MSNNNAYNEDEEDYLDFFEEDVYQEDYEDYEDEEEDYCEGGYPLSQCEMTSICTVADECELCGHYQYYP